MKTVGIYVPSYNRPNNIITFKHLPFVTYVVRKSEEQLYRNSGVTNILAVEDEKINSWTKVMTYIARETPEDLTVSLDDDIDKWIMRGIKNNPVEDHEVVQMELLRICQMISDLKIGYGSLTFTPTPWSYTGEFRFCGNAGSVYFFNKKHLKAKYDQKGGAFCDTDFQLQELLANRVVLIPQYLVAIAKLNKGRDTQGRDSSLVLASGEYMKAKWGSAYSYNPKTRKGKVVVKR